MHAAHDTPVAQALREKMQAAWPEAEGAVSSICACVVQKARCCSFLNISTALMNVLLQLACMLLA